MKKHTPSASGFTLIEVTMVLVIIALLIGGVLVGKDLIEAARVRKLASEVEQITTAVNTFKGKYNCLPGDCANATQFFSGVSNGNGDGKINGWTCAGPPCAYEARYLWHHLKLANLLSVPVSSPNLLQGWGDLLFQPGIHVPASGWGQGALYMLAHDDTFAPGKGWGQNAGGTVWDFYVPINYGHSIIVAGGTDPNAGVMNFTNIFTVEQAKIIDAKFDDGYATGGKIVGGNMSGGCFAVNTQSNTLPYAGGWGTEKSCLLVFNNLF